MPNNSFVWTCKVYIFICCPGQHSMTIFSYSYSQTLSSSSFWFFFFVFKKIYALKGTLLAEHKASCIKKLVNDKEKQKQSLAFRAKQTSQYGICFTVK